MPDTTRRQVHVIVEPDARQLALAEMADTVLTRLVGLLGRRSLAPGDGLVLDPCSSVHTWFMRFPIDVLFLDRDGVVQRAVHAMGPWRMAAGGWSARKAVELPAGTLARTGVTIGARVRFDPA